MNNQISHPTIKIDKMRYGVLAIGCLTVIYHQCIHAIPVHAQMIILIVGIALLGIPHGAADLLIGMQTASLKKRNFSRTLF